MQNSDGQDLVVQVYSVARVMARESQRLFRPHGLTDAQFNVLNVLGSRPAGVSQRELSDVLVVDRSNITGLLDRMETNGWVKRTDHPGDRRVYLVTLTAAGRKLWRLVQPEYEAAVRRVVAKLPRADLTRALDTLRQLEAAAIHWGKSHEA